MSINEYVMAVKLNLYILTLHTFGIETLRSNKNAPIGLKTKGKLEIKYKKKFSKEYLCLLFSFVIVNNY